MQKRCLQKQQLPQQKRALKCRAGAVLGAASAAQRASALEGLAKARHPAAMAAAKAAGQAPAKQEMAKKRSCSSRKPACALTNGGEMLIC